MIAETGQLAKAGANVDTDVGVDVEVQSDKIGAFDYISFSANKFMLLASNHAKATASLGSEGNCPGIEEGPETPCENDRYFDGTACVFAQDCPCIS